MLSRGALVVWGDIILTQTHADFHRLFNASGVAILIFFLCELCVRKYTLLKNSCVSHQSATLMGVGNSDND